MIIKEYDLINQIANMNIDYTVDNIFDFKDCLFQENATSNVLYPNLKKWFQYMIEDCGDADQVLKTNTNRIVLKQLGWNITYIDCIFSMKTFLNAFLRWYFNGKIPSYMSIYELFNNFFSKDAIKKFSDENDIEEGVVFNLLGQLELFAKLTHTLGNYMPCIDSSYNSIKGFGKGYIYFQDRIELLYDELVNQKYDDYAELDSERREFWKEWFEESKDNFYLNDMLENKILKEFKCPCIKGKNHTLYKMCSSQNLEDYTNYLNEVNRLIIERNEKISNKIRLICN